MQQQQESMSYKSSSHELQYLSPVLKLSRESFVKMMDELKDVANLKSAFCAMIAAIQERESLDEWELGGLMGAVSLFEQHVREDFNEHNNGRGGDFDFFNDLFPAILEWARQCYDDDVSTKLALLSKINAFEFSDDECSGPRPTDQVISLSRLQIRNLLANAFLLNLNYSRQEGYGNLSFHRIYQASSPLSIHRSACLLSYFFQMRYCPEELANYGDAVVFERHVGKPQFGDCQSEDVLLTDAHLDVRVHTGRMEDPEVGGFVNFANAQLHIGRVITSATQEEVLFSCCPEAFVGLLFVERLGDQEILLIRNTVRFSDYTGYLFSFQFKGMYPRSGPQRCTDLVVLDAVYRAHFSKSAVQRDINKARLGFLHYCTGSARVPHAVSTGHWGCGVFGGDFIAKFLQQVVAARLAGLPLLHYSTFNNSLQQQAFQAVLDAMVEKQTTIGHAIYLLLEFESQKTRWRLGFQDYLFSKLGIKSDNHECTSSGKLGEGETSCMLS
uniref:poly(ADP-ribose) glycohydrolase n=1 Tax=Heterosigma akashiwo TaxID=2829 RepID=A0A6S9L5M5_HETAK|mmetsp:Transcript_37915/g.66281  ORF Transcript_37915/g.66281 Transcript_37915/m.66281 type:complete len:499 (-) Transcript_37915:242-1738(-)